MDELLRKISFHDAIVTEYEKKGRNVFLELKDGWTNNLYYKIELSNVEIEMQKYDKAIVLAGIKLFNDINDYGLDLFAGEVGKYKDGKFFLKLWVEYPEDTDSIDLNEKLEFDGFSINLSDEFDDVGRFFIKFIFDDVFVNIVNTGNEEGCEIINENA